MKMTRGDGLLNSTQAAVLVGRQAATIRRWKCRGYLHPAGLDEQRRPLYSRQAVRQAELTARANGLRTKGVDPRRQKPAPRFSPAFKAAAVLTVAMTGRPVAEVAQEVGVSTVTLRNWVTTLGPAGPEGDGPRRQVPQAGRRRAA